ncbi:PorT family protein [Polaribacter sp. WD7]|uniref:outer membrane beta-barrel protein n=1 Tax=Polaribacter sp. WD7 TaxID=2269061 RepID=UPI000DF20DC8|nr:outer membrane beta-barrel protein [Polaribacter sp. WD7]RCS26754.1 PorT family protein [Polaribacter sp. WD7]
MKKIFIISFFLFLSLTNTAQIKFEKGYFIKNNKEKVECLIKNIGWRYTPTQIDYKLASDTEIKTMKLTNIVEFGIYDDSKFIKRTVDIDRSSSDVDVFDEDRNPNFKTETIFLKLLLKGDINLYQYTNKDLFRFFYEKKATKEIKQLVYKQYYGYKYVDGNPVRGGVKTNNGFRQQIINYFDSKCVDTKNVKNLRYSKNDLVPFFKEFNQCSNKDINYITKKNKRRAFNFTVKVGLNNTSVSVLQTAVREFDFFSFDNKPNLKLGFELEHILSFNKNKWSIIFEPTYQSINFQGEQSETFQKNFNYSSVEIAIGVRHYLFLNTNNKFFINGMFVLSYAVNDSSAFLFTEQFIKPEIIHSFPIATGIGYQYSNKIGIELRYYSNRKLFSDFSFLNAKLDNIALVLGYTF